MSYRLNIAHHRSFAGITGVAMTTENHKPLSDLQILEKIFNGSGIGKKLELSFSYTPFEYFNYKLVDSKVVELTIDYVSIPTIPDILFQLTSLESLIINDKKLKKLPVEVSRLPNLRHLGLTKLDPSSIPDELWTSNNIQSITLGSWVGEMYEDCEATVTVYPKTGRITIEDPYGIPDTLQALSSLIKVTQLDITFSEYYCDGHEISLPQWITNFTLLKSLSIRADQVSPCVIDYSHISQISSLERLELRSLFFFDDLTLGPMMNLRELILVDICFHDFLPNFSNLNLTSLTFAYSQTYDQEDDIPPHEWNPVLATVGDVDEDHVPKFRLLEFPSEICFMYNLQSLSLRNHTLTNIPSELSNLRVLEHLDLAGNHLSDLPPEFFQLESLQTLSLENNDFFTLPNGLCRMKSLSDLTFHTSSIHPAFSSLSIEILLWLNQFQHRLRELLFNDHVVLKALSDKYQLTHVPSITVEDQEEQPCLACLTIEKEKITGLVVRNIPVGDNLCSLPTLPHLKRLVLENIPNIVLPDDWSAFQSVERVILTNLGTSLISSGFSVLRNLRTLELRDWPELFILPDIFYEMNLATITITATGLSVLPNSLVEKHARYLRHLTENDASVVASIEIMTGKTNIKHEHDRTSKLVTKLDLSGLALTSLPLSVSKLAGLKVLNLADNNLKVVPPEIGQMRSLRVLYLDHNNIKTLPAEFLLKQPNLTELSLIACPLEILRGCRRWTCSVCEDPTFAGYPPHEVFRGTTELQELAGLVRFQSYLSNEQLDDIRAQCGISPHLELQKCLFCRNNIEATSIHHQLCKCCSDDFLGLGKQIIWGNDNVRVEEVRNLLRLEEEIGIVKSKPPEKPLDPQEHYFRANEEGFVQELVIGNLFLGGCDDAKDFFELIARFDFLETLQFTVMSKNLQEAIYEGLGKMINPLPQLMALVLQKCGLEEVPMFVSQLVNVRHLDLSQNRISTLPSWLESLSSLEEIIMDSNTSNPPPKREEVVDLEQLPPDVVPQEDMKQPMLDHHNPLVEGKRGRKKLSQSLTQRSLKQWF